MAQKVFVFGTLKKGFPLHDRGLAGANFLGLYRTRDRFPMLIAGPRFAPMMFNEPGIGCHVAGELYGVADGAMSGLDRLERVGEPGNLRLRIDVEPLAGGKPVSAFAYLKMRDLAEPRHSDYLETYDDRRFRD
ncbi:gamma-glutamylcyclotransferase family protein [Mesorhizobium sp. 43Arga]